MQYLRPLYVATILSVSFEAFIFIIFGLILYPEGNIFYKLIWTIFFCGLGMGGAIGTWINILIIDSYNGFKAIVYTVLIATVFLTACDLLCLKIDHVFHYFGAHTNPYLFFVSGFIMTIIGSIIAGILLFTKTGDKVLSSLGL